MNGHAVTRFETAKVLQQGSNLIHPDVQLLIGDNLMRFVFRFRDVDDRSLIFVLLEMPVDAVVAGIQLATDKPLPARRIAGVKHCMPVLIPVQQFGVCFKALGKIVQAEPLIYPRVSHIGLSNKLCRRMEIFLFLPVHSNLRFARLVNF